MKHQFEKALLPQRFYRENPLHDGMRQEHVTTLAPYNVIKRLKCFGIAIF
jgi:hypothetical protein